MQYFFFFFYIVLATHLLPVCFLLTELAAPPRVDGGLELLQSGGQHGPALSPLLLSLRAVEQGPHRVGAGGGGGGGRDEPHTHLSERHSNARVNEEDCAESLCFT